MEDYFKKTKQKFHEQIPEYGTEGFGKIRDEIKKGLQRKETENLLLVRKLKTLVLGDWNTNEKKKRLYSIKNMLLENGYYAETIDAYLDSTKRSNLNSHEVLEYCCRNHQLIVFLDGDGSGTITEQNYLITNYRFHIKIIFFIDGIKFDKFKNESTPYFIHFPTIIKYKRSELLDDALTYISFRIHRLAYIINSQKRTGKGLSSIRYTPWKYRA